MFVCLYIVLVLLVSCSETAKYTIADATTAAAYPCRDTKSVISTYNFTQTGPNKHYELFIYLSVMHDRVGIYPIWSFIRRINTVTVRFSDAVNATLIAGWGFDQYGRFSHLSPKLFYVGNNTILIDNFQLNVEVSIAGLRSGSTFPYITGIDVNGMERCTEPETGIFDDLMVGLKETKNKTEIKKEPVCGRRQLLHTELITHGFLTKPGDWPWHTAIYRKEKNTYEYICGGTLLSKTFVLTAAHCLMIRGVKKVLPKNNIKIYIGLYNLHETDRDIQERKVSQIIIHPNFNTTNVNNDISLLRLDAEAQLNDIVQPACLWKPEVLNVLGNDVIYGTVAGWGFDQNDRLSSQLRQATIPIVDNLICINSNNIFFGNYLNQYKFCAGYTNGTSACNGDSGGGFVVFVPDEKTQDKKHSFLSGSWYVRGIVSVAISRRDASICEPNSYVLFTDVDKYTDWIEGHLNSNETLDSGPENTFNNNEENVYDTEVEILMDKTPSIVGPACGRRQLTHAELMVNANPSSPGDWPWHAAVYARESSDLKYVSGGTLISKNLVICAAGSTSKATPVAVSLGKYSLLNVEEEVQTREVQKVITHENFTIDNLANDIALLKLKNEVVYGDFIQPACLWNKEVEEKVAKTITFKDGIFGSVAGWGFDETGQHNSELRSASFPIVDNVECALKSNITYQGKFCAGTGNGTSPCIGDGGGGFIVFVPQSLENPTSSGNWYLRGLVSVAAVTNGTHMCDSFNYVFYTDMKFYSDWVERKVLEESFSS